MTKDMNIVKKSNILQLINDAKKGLPTEIDFVLELPNGKSLNCQFRKSDALTMPNRDMLLIEDKIAEYEKAGHHLRDIDEKEWQQEIEDSMKFIEESNKKKKSKDEKVDLIEYRKTLEKKRPTHKAEQMARKAAKMELLTVQIPSIIRIEGQLLESKEERDGFAEILTATNEISQFVIEQYVRLSELFFTQKEEIKNSLKVEN